MKPNSLFFYHIDCGLSIISKKNCLIQGYRIFLLFSIRWLCSFKVLHLSLLSCLSSLVCMGWSKCLYAYICMWITDSFCSTEETQHFKSTVYIPYFLSVSHSCILKTGCLFLKGNMVIVFISLQCTFISNYFGAVSAICRKF